MITATPAPSTPEPRQPAMGDDEGREAEIGLGLAAAGREEQQIGGLAVGMLAIGKPGEIEQDEGELERPPFRRGLRRRIAVCAGVAPPRRHRHGEVHDSGRRSRAMSLSRQDVDARRDALLRGSPFRRSSRSAVSRRRVRQAAELASARASIHAP